MRRVEVEIKATFQDVGIVLTRMEMVLSVTGITHGSSEQTMDDNGMMVERVTIGANETPGGADGYLTKPFTRSELLSAVESRLRRFGKLT